MHRDQLQPAIESTKELKRKVAPQTSRSSEGSTTYSKKYPGGSLTLAIATSAADLRSKTIKKLLRDEIATAVGKDGAQGARAVLKVAVRELRSAMLADGGIGAASDDEADAA